MRPGFAGGTSALYRKWQRGEEENKKAPSLREAKRGWLSVAMTGRVLYAIQSAQCYPMHQVYKIIQLHGFSYITIGTAAF